MADLAKLPLQDRAEQALKEVRVVLKKYQVDMMAVPEFAQLPGTNARGVNNKFTFVEEQVQSEAKPAPAPANA